MTTLTPEIGRDLLKQVRRQLTEIAQPALDRLVQDITGIKPRSLHHDVSTLTGEEVVIFTLNDFDFQRAGAASELDGYGLFGECSDGRLSPPIHLALIIAIGIGGE